MMEQYPPVAIALLNYNGRKHLEHYLPSAAESAYPRLTIWMIDNDSTDSSMELLKYSFPQVRVVRHTTNLGFAGGYNEGIKSIDAPYILFLNSDVAVTPGFLQPMVRMMQQHQDLAFVQPRICSDRNRHELEYAGAGGGFMDLLGYPFCRGRIFDTLEADRGQYNDERHVAWASGAALLVRKEAFEALGGFYEWFFMHHEEIDLCWRAWNRGWKVGYCGQSVVYHLGGGSLQKERPQKTFYNFRNNLVMLARNMPFHTLLPVLCIRLVLDMAAALQMAIQGKSSHAAAAVQGWMAFLGWIFSANKRGKWPGHRKNLPASVRYNSSIVWQYYVRGRKTAGTFKPPLP